MLTPDHRHAPVTGGGAAVVAAPSGRLPKAYTLDELSARTDALALAIGARVTASTILLACVIVILIGAQSLLATMQGMDRDLQEMNKQLAIANVGLVVLNTTMDSVPPTARHIEAIVGTVQETSDEVKVSVGHIDGMADTTGEINEQLASIADSTGSMRTSLEGASGDTTTLATTIGQLNGDIEPLVKTQHEMLLGTRSMRRGLDGMNASLAYVVRIMNYITVPPTGGGMTIRADLPKETLPPIPGIKAEVDPVPVFPRGIWPVYTGP
jgi:methyl-accepting chemotaxis protein